MILFDAIDFIVGILTFRWLWKKGPLVVEGEMKRAYSDSAEAKKLDDLACAVESRRTKEPIKTTTANDLDTD